MILQYLLHEFNSWLIVLFYCFSFINSIHEVPCYEKAYWREKRLKVLPERCGVMLTDNLLPEDQVLKLRSLATKLIDKVGDTSYANRESINLQWINLHNLYKRNVTKKVLKDWEFDLIRNASIAARVKRLFTNNSLLESNLIYWFVFSFCLIY